VVLSTRQAQVEHAPRRVADVLEAVHHVARDEDDGAGAGRRGLATAGQFVGALDDEEYFFLVEMDVVARAFTGLEPPHEDRDSATGGLGGEEYFQVEPKGLIDSACSGLTMVACSGEVLWSLLPPVCGLVNRRDCCVMNVPPSALCNNQ
jgi:hypothetical protein